MWHLFNYIQSNLKVAENFQENVAIFAPNCEKIYVGGDDAGPFIIQYAIKEDLLAHNRRTHFSSCFLRAGITVTPLLLFCLDFELICNFFYHFVRCITENHFKNMLIYGKKSTLFLLQCLWYTGYTCFCNMYTLRLHVLSSNQLLLTKDCFDWQESSYGWFWTQKKFRKKTFCCGLLGPSLGGSKQPPSFPYVWLNFLEVLKLYTKICKTQFHRELALCPSSD